MKTNQLLCLHGLPTLGTTALALMEMGAGITTGVHMVATAMAVTASGLCLGDQVFDHLHGADNTQDEET